MKLYYTLQEAIAEQAAAYDIADAAGEGHSFEYKTVSISVNGHTFEFDYGSTLVQSMSDSIFMENEYNEQNNKEDKVTDVDYVGDCFECEGDKFGYHICNKKCMMFNECTRAIELQDRLLREEREEQGNMPCDNYGMLACSTACSAYFKCQGRS
jgi:hypothetical protein